ncbi:hypothetical protein [Streptomyces regalis]|nr:hypothetical protein [Streptomyces regalis]
MKTSFKVHGAIAGGASAVLLSLAALTWVPGVWLSKEAGTAAMVLGGVLLFPVFGAALIRALLARATKAELWHAFRCLPGTVQLALATLLVSGFVIGGMGAGGAAGLQDASIENGRYYAFEATPGHRGRTEISRSEYLAVVRGDLRMMLAIPGVLFAGAAFHVLATGELRRADAANAAAGHAVRR